MIQNPYSRYRGKDLTLNDHLAIDRTILSNERTLLAYIRTALALVIVGGSCIKFFASFWMGIVGAAFIVTGGLVAIRGLQRYGRMRAFMAAALDVQTGKPEHPLAEAVDAKSKTEDDADRMAGADKP